MSQEPKTPMTEMHDFIISTQIELFKENKSPEVLKLVLMLNELSKITQELLDYEKKYIEMIKAEGMQEGVNAAKKIFDNNLNSDNGNFFTACIN
jgi:hypothetical protein